MKSCQECSKCPAFHVNSIGKAIKKEFFNREEPRRAQFSELDT